jgi:hypothetical protein
MQNFIESCQQAKEKNLKDVLEITYYVISFNKKNKKDTDAVCYMETS